jgi:acyl-CoA reductase-like NAD-dependent aldehyde dehydrogenase
LWKPSENAPRFATVWTSILQAAGFGEDLFRQLPATREAGTELIEADIDFLHFTGSEAVGRKIAARLGQRLIPSTLELSGNDALFVLADADVQLAARSAWYGSTLNRGRTCMATRRVFVAEVVAKEFIAELFANQATYDKTHPTNVLLEIPLNEASFDPTLAVRVFRTMDEASALHAESQHRLTAAVFTHEPAKHEAWARSLGIGTVTFNDVIVPTAHPATPFPAAGASGWGSTQGPEGLLAFTRPQVVTTRGGRFRPHIDTDLEADPAGDDVTTGILLTRHSRTWGGLFRGLGQMFRGFRHFGKKSPANRNPTTTAD